MRGCPVVSVSGVPDGTLFLFAQLTRQWNWRAIFGSAYGAGARACYFPFAVNIRPSISSSASSSVPAIIVMEIA
jgi:hypothetical protein